MAYFWPRMHKWNLLGRGILGVLSSSELEKKEKRKNRLLALMHPSVCWLELQQQLWNHERKAERLKEVPA